MVFREIMASYEEFSYLCAMRILVTGASGFVGAHLVKELMKNPDVQIIGTSFRHSVPVQNITTKKLDITNAADVWAFLEENPVDTIVHTAARVSFRKKDKERIYQINVTGTKNIVDAMLEKKIPRIIYISSVAALAKKTDALITEEDIFEKTNTSSVYGHSKFLGELEIWRGQEEGLQVTVLNPSLIIGASLSNWKHSSTGLFPRVFKGLPYLPPGAMGFVSVEDLVRVIVQSIFSEEAVGKKWIVSAENRSWASVLRKIARSLGKNNTGKILPRSVLFFYARLAKIFPEKFLPVTSEEAVASASVFRYDNSKIRNEFYPEFKSIDKEIEETAKKYLEYLKAR